MMIREGLISGAIEWNEDEEKNIAYDQFPAEQHQHKRTKEMDGWRRPR